MNPLEAAVKARRRRQSLPSTIITFSQPHLTMNFCEPTSTGPQHFINNGVHNSDDGLRSTHSQSGEGICMLDSKSDPVILHSPMVVDDTNNSADNAAMYLSSLKPSSASTTLLSASTPSLDDNLDNNRDRWRRTIQQSQKRQEEELKAILVKIESLGADNNSDNDDEDEEEDDHLDDSSYDSSSQTPRKEYTVRHYPNGNLFSGNIDVHTQLPIYGRMTYASEMMVYEGPFRNGERHGQGATCIKVDGSAKFLGRYECGHMHSGTLIVSSYTYTGTFLNDDFHGVGTMVSCDGGIYQGNFVNGQYHGVGTLRTMTHLDHDEDSTHQGNKKKGEESLYIGDFVEGIFHGHGSLTMSEGSSFVGSWREGERVMGIETLSNGDVYEGSYMNNIREGRGTLTTKNGRMKLSGVWKGGKLTDNVELSIVFANGHTYCGDHVESIPHGFGRMNYVDTGTGTSTYTGWFVNGVRHGMGRCFFHKTGEEYEGEWVCDEPIGLKIFQFQGPYIERSQLAEDRGQQLVHVQSCPSISKKNHRRKSTGSYDMLTCPSVISLSSLTSQNCDISPVSRDTVNKQAVNFHCKDVRIDPKYKMKEVKQVSNEDIRKCNLGGPPLHVRTFESDIMSSLISDMAFEYTEEIKFYKYDNGDTFEGYVDKFSGFRQGLGVYTEHRTKSIYSGDWKDSKRHGAGHLKLASGVEYLGEFGDDKIHGEGRLTVGTVVYTGSFCNGLLHGRGMLEDEESSGRVYFGEFENGERSGEGEETFLDGTQYKGQFKFGKRSGFGIQFDSDDSEIYRGEWDDNLRHGKGILLTTFLQGGRYDGDFFQNKFSGSGKFTFADGTSIEGQWLDDVPRDGDWSILYPDGSKYYGFATFQPPLKKRLSNDSLSIDTTATSLDLIRVPLPHGFGSLTQPNGQRFVGSFCFGNMTK